MPVASRTRTRPTSPSRGRRVSGTRRRAVLRVEGLVVRAPDGTVILDDVSFAVPAGTVVAVVGPTGAGKTTLLNAITGMVDLDAGRVVLDGADLATADEAGRRRVGYVPQHDALHAELDLRRTLDYSATLRLPSSYDQGQRSQRVDGVLDELGLTGHAHLPVASLSGGQRKRASVAVELIAEPDVLILDEPTSGLDPGYEKSMMRTLRDLADRGRTVVTVTHSLQVLSRCDLALFLAPGGRVAFYGPPAEAVAYFGSGDAADVFLALDSGPSLAWKDKFRRHPSYTRWVDAPDGERTTPLHVPASRGPASQLAILIRRYVDLIRADRRQALMLCLQGPVLGALLWSVLAPGGLRHAAAGDPQAATVAVFVAISVTWLGAANAVREIVKEQRVLRREQGGGLSVGAYVGSKMAVLGVMTMVQAAVLAMIAVGRQHGVSHGAILPNATIELMTSAAVMALAAVAVGLLVSAIVDTPDKAQSLLPIILVGQLVLSGGWVSVLHTPVLHQLADITSARWGVAAFEATGRGDGHAWLAAMAALAGITATSGMATAVLVRVRLQPAHRQRRAARGAALVPLCAAVCAVAVLGLGAHSARSTPPPAANARIAQPPATVARVPTKVAAPQTPQARGGSRVATPVQTPAPATGQPPHAAAPTATSVPAASPSVVVVPNGSPTPAATPPVTAPPTTQAPDTTTTPPTTAAPQSSPTSASAAPANNWSTLASMAYQWWVASQAQQTPH